jgi:hypothetical protein
VRRTIVRLGSLRDPEVARDAKLTAAISGLVFFLLALPKGLASIVALLATGAALLAIVMRLRGGAAVSGGDTMDTPHRGPNVSKIPIAGFPGLVFVIGFGWMFWSGLPQLHAVVVALAVSGLFGGVWLVAFRRRHQSKSATLLGLHADGRSGGEMNDAPRATGRRTRA